MNRWDIRPLSYSEEPPRPKWRHFIFDGWRRSRRAKALEAQMRERDAVPEGVWGDDPERRKVARDVCEVFREAFLWPNAHFIPEDPFRYVFFNVDTDGYMADGSEHNEAAACLTKYFEVDVWNELKAAWDKDLPLGAAIDMLIDKRNSARNDS